MNVAKDYWRCVLCMSSGKVPELFVEVPGKDENKCTWERTVEGRAVDRALMDYVVTKANASNFAICKCA